MTRDDATGGREPAVRIDRRFFPDQSLSPLEATRLQREWAGLIEEAPLPAPPRVVAGSDVHMRGDRALATVVLVRFPDLDVLETARGEAALGFPYIPGLLSWREVPALLAALAHVTVRPDLLFADGQGVAHPRGLGLACHLGLATGLPTLGCAKSILRGNHPPLGEARGARAPLVYKGQVVGTALRSKDRVKPLYVSVGDRITLDEATDYVLRCCTRYRLPEPNRLAHKTAQAWARGEG
ncbi:MAG TPA: endonuclease V [Thermomicrobiales bacterium]|nr:endonuclease V [Thermomicrobiales bacterium]